MVETIREGRASREPGRTADLFSYARPARDGEWKNKLIWGDNLLVMASLLEEFAGKVDLIYIDPPFHAGADFSFKAQIGEATVEKTASLIEEKAYREYWQGVSFGDEKPAEPDAAAVAAYIRFILDLYHAQPLVGVHLHGCKGPALVHVGAVDAPVTIRQVNEAVAETATLDRKELHVLGWEWEMGLHDPLAQQVMREHGIKLRLLNIPREVMERRAVEAGDIRFFDLAHLEAEIVPVGAPASRPAAGGKARKIQVRLRNFVIPDTDLIPDEVRARISKWSDYIDYWAVDWDFRHDTFMNQWQAYRTRQHRKLALESDAHEYPEPGHYQVLVKVVDIFGKVDIFGNDTSKLLVWETR